MLVAALLFAVVRRAATRETIAQLGRAIEIGCDDFEHLEVDPGLDSLRKVPAYRGNTEFRAD
jgi:hypothetical protein